MQKRLLEDGHENISVVEGGLNAWIDAGYPIEGGESRIWSLERQVRFVAGLLVLLGVILSLVLNPAFLILSGIVGAGLVFCCCNRYLWDGHVISYNALEQGSEKDSR